MNRVAFRISLLYMLTGAIWIWGSDQLVLRINPSLDIRYVTFLQSTKGFVYVFLTTGLLYLLVKKPYRRLQQSEQRYRKLFDESPAPKLVYEEGSSQILDANKAACSKYGYKKEEFPLLRLKALCPDTAHFKEWLNSLQGRNGSPTVAKHKKKDGTPFYVQAYTSATQDNGRATRLLTALDVHDKVIAEQKSEELSKNIMEREKFFRSLIDSQTNYLARIDKKGCYTFVNKRFCEKFGFTTEEIKGLHYQKTVMSEDWDTCREAEKLCKEKPGTIVSLEIREKDKAGDISWTSWEFIGITNEEGETATIQGVGHDVTAQKLAELKEKQALERYNTIAKATKDVAYDRDFKTGKLSWNSAIFSSMKYQHHEVEETINWWEERLHPNDKSGVLQELHQAINEGKESWNSKYRFLCGNKEYRHFHERGYILYNENKEPVRMIGIIQDIHNEKEVRKEITKLSLVARKTQNSVIITNKEGHIEWVNEGFTRQTGYQLGEVIGKKPGSFLQGPLSDKETVQAVREKLQQREKFTAELINYRKDNSFYWVRMFISPIFNEEEELVQYIAMETDITERKQFIAKLERQNKQLREVAWISSHEIRRPVASILGLLSLYDSRRPEAPFNQEIIQHLGTTTKELDGVIHRIVNKTYEVEELETSYMEEKE